MWLGTIAAAVAVGTGWWAANHVAHTEEAHRLMTIHKRLGWAVLTTAIVLSAWKVWAREETQHRFQSLVFLLQIVLVAVLGYSTHSGGRMVYEFGVGTAFLRSEEGAPHPHGEEASGKRENAEEDTHAHEGHQHTHSEGHP